MGSGIGRMHDDWKEGYEKAYYKKLENMSVYELDLIVSSAWYVVRTFEDKSTIHQQSAALEMLKMHLKDHTR